MKTTAKKTREIEAHRQKAIKMDGIEASAHILSALSQVPSGALRAFATGRARDGHQDLAILDLVRIALARRGVDQSLRHVSFEYAHYVWNTRGQRVSNNTIDETTLANIDTFTNENL